MKLLIPLGGLGTRFKKFNYKLPKPLINAMGKPILYWLLDNLNLNKITDIIIPYNKELSNYNFEDVLRNKYHEYNFLFIKLENNTRGAAETILMALNLLNETNDSPILCLDGDNFYLTDIISLWNGENCVFSFKDYNIEPIYSYLKMNNNNIIDIKEKNKISDNACTGAYSFNSWIILKKYCNIIIENNIMQKNEFYTSTVIKQMLKDNHIFKNINIEKKDYICLGTPIQLRLFCNNLPKINAINNKRIIDKKRYCFDLDNTLVSFPKIRGDYTSVEPIQKNIDFLKYLQKLGNYIIIYTARRMKTFDGNLGKLNKNIGKITFETLEKFDIPYDEIYFGKPYADCYIDDLAISAYENLEKHFGFYRSFISPRDFNEISNKSFSIFRKESDDLSGEIYFYNNLPIEIKDMFPILINYDINNKWYEMEEIDGIPISKLFLSQEMNIDLLNHIIGSINRIHYCKINEKLNTNINIYSNYSNKLKTRYKDYDYSKFINSDKIYNELIIFFDNYEKNNRGTHATIHGDTVLTNILINSFGKIKFIDMRGKQNNILTNQGDIFYDWAKLYQSIIGYDEILDNINLENQYKNNIIKYFENWFTNKFSCEYLNTLKYITKLHLFTLLPLHDNDKCFKYYNLINQI
jgi:capsule biosynthesis phosphatase